MRAVLATQGTTGDVEPLIALARALTGRGHSAVLAAPPNFAARARAVGVGFAPLGAPTDSAAMRSVFAPTGSMLDPAEQARHTLPSLLASVPRALEELEALCQEADVLVSVPYQLAGRMVHERTSIPHVSLHLSPFGNMGGKRFAEATAPLINACRGGLGFPPLRDPLGADAVSSRLALFPVSGHVFRRPVRWPAHHHVTGYLFVEEAPPEDRALEDFLADAGPPVVITFGSMVHEDPDAVTALLVEALERAGCRGIIQRGWSGLCRGPMPRHTHAVDFVPHAWLFQRASCVVHVGGAGTTAAALRAGSPSVIVPHWLDQPIWAQLAAEAGCAGGVIPFARLTVEALAGALEHTLGAPGITEAAGALARRIKDEDGAGRACALIEQALAR